MNLTILNHLTTLVIIARASAIWLAACKNSVHESISTTYALVYVYSGNRTVFGASSAFHTTIFSNYLCQTMCYGKNFVRAYSNAHPATNTLFVMKLQCSHVF